MKLLWSGWDFVLDLTVNNDSNENYSVSGMSAPTLPTVRAFTIDKHKIGVFVQIYFQPITR